MKRYSKRSLPKKPSLNSYSRLPTEIPNKDFKFPNFTMKFHYQLNYSMAIFKDFVSKFIYIALLAGKFHLELSSDSHVKIFNPTL